MENSLLAPLFICQEGGNIMKNLKKAAAILGIVVLLLAACMPMFFAMTDSNLFRASWGVAILVPILGYLFWMMYRLLDKRKGSAEGKMKNVIFDVGLVLVDFDWQGYLKSFGFPEEENKLIGEKVFLSQQWNERDRGLYDEETYVKAFERALPEYAQDVRKVLEGSSKTIKVRDYADTWTKYLRSKGYRLYVLSNYCDYALKQTRKDLTFLKNMDGIIFSCEVQQLKPEKDIYETLLGRYGLKAEESVFLDDRAENCEAARQLGIHAIQFHDFKQAVAELEKLGIK